MDIKEEKKVLREEAKRIEKEITEDRIRMSDEKIFEQLMNNPRFISARNLFIYISVDREPDTLRLIDEALKRGKNVFVPKCGKKPFMKAVKIASREELREGSFGIPEPLSDEDFEGDLDLAVVPCVRATWDGRRLGHGGGFYDCFLGKRKIYKICLCRKEIMTEKLPEEDFDVIMDEVISG